MLPLSFHIILSCLLPLYMSHYQLSCGYTRILTVDRSISFSDYDRASSKLPHPLKIIFVLSPSRSLKKVSPWTSSSSTSAAPSTSKSICRGGVSHLQPEPFADGQVSNRHP
ncbi:hypothetical protein Lal_00019410 [Lupinus albus]|nr:hypothetical protein Lal_00019410 [Lupinus albus]